MGRETKVQVGCSNVFGEPAIKRGKDGLTDGSTMFQDIVAPDTQDQVALRAHKIVAAAVIGTVGVLGSIDLDDEPIFAACEVCVEGADGELTGKAMTAKFARFQFKPRQCLCLVARLAELSRSLRCASIAAAARSGSAFPHSVAASQRHLSPLRRERKGARRPKLAPFLSPADRRRGGERSSTEWGSTIHQINTGQKSVGAPPSAVRFWTKALSSSRMAGSM